MPAKLQPALNERLVGGPESRSRRHANSGENPRENDRQVVERLALRVKAAAS